MTCFADIARRRPDILVIAAFLWAPAWLAAGLGAGALYPALVIASVPLVLAFGWIVAKVWKGTDQSERWWLLIAMCLVAAMIVGANWAPPPEH